MWSDWFKENIPELWEVAKVVEEVLDVENVAAQSEPVRRDSPVPDRVRDDLRAALDDWDRRIGRAALSSLDDL